jgi:hypothetical protein
MNTTDLAGNNVETRLSHAAIPDTTAHPVAAMPRAIRPGVQPYSRRAPAGGRPNKQISLRLPANWIMMLRERAIEAASREQRMITPQEIVRRIVASALSQPE